MNVKQDQPVIPFESRDAWEAWLAEHHATSPGLWLQFAKKGSGIATVSYSEALDVALCYGWIDGQKDKLDGHYWLQRFTPRRPRSNWSRINRDRVAALVARGAMKPAGLREVERAGQRRQPTLHVDGAGRHQAIAVAARHDARQREPVRDPLPPARSQEARDAGAPPEGVRGHAERGQEDPPLRRILTDHAGSARTAGRPKVPSTTSTKVLSSRRMMRRLRAIVKFARASSSDFSRAR